MSQAPPIKSLLSISLMPHMNDLFGGVSQPWVVAHRGGAGEASENTWEAFEHCKNSNIKIIETDVWLGDDGKLHVSHGKFWNDFRRHPIHIPSKETGPRFTDILMSYPDICFCVDPKHPPAFEALLHTVFATDSSGRVCISPSYYWRVLRTAKHAQDNNMSIMTGLSAWGIFTHLLPSSLFPGLISPSTVVVFTPKWIARKWFIQYAHKRKLNVIVQKVTPRMLQN